MKEKKLVCEECKKKASHLYTLPSEKKVCLACFHSSLGHSAYKKLKVPIN